MRKLNSKESKEYIQEFIETRIVQWKRDFYKDTYYKNQESIRKYQREYRLDNLEEFREKEKERYEKRMYMKKCSQTNNK